ncbi:MAG: xanthine dehydrogenase family protein molybdopterin-binding subunit [Planctomycetota bacterium]|jgi:xanthine dehydrogenase YagR molybdenum-binding subunit|nr:xanthine dehydrogenase family protein molybdopterin-binding subunit [Planctomycetota bacterium]
MTGSGADVDHSWPAVSERRLIGKRVPRVDGPAKLTGKAVYTQDVRLPRMAWGRLVPAPVAGGKVRVDLAPALAIEGVLGGIVLGETVRYLGQPVAALAAENSDLLEDGLAAVVVEVVEEGWALTREQSLAPEAPRVGRRGNRSGERTRGDGAAARRALAECAATIEGTWQMPIQHHLCLETHSAVVDYSGGESATVYLSTQGTYGSSFEAAEELGLKAAEVRLVCEHMGGGFGSKFDLGIEGLAACRLAKQLKRPVRVANSRRDEFLFAGNRSGSRQQIRLGANKGGHLRALVAEVERFGGIGRGSHPGLPYIYEVRESAVTSSSVHTSTDSSRAMRAPGHPQASFAMEGAVDLVAIELGLDPLLLRKRNLESEVYHRQLDRVAELIGWEQHAHRTSPASPAAGERSSGIGFAVSTWGGGGRPGARAEVRIERDGTVSVASASQDLGTGTRTHMAVVVAEALGLRVEDVSVHIGDSRLPRSVTSGGSVTSACLAPAVQDAASQARAEFLKHLGRVLDAPVGLLRLEDRRLLGPADWELPQLPAAGLDWGQACALLGSTGLSAQGEFQRELASSGVHGAQAARVEVDTGTGRVAIKEFACVQDCGLVLNRLAVESQIRGAIVQALSHGMLEERVVDGGLGLVLSADLMNYKAAVCAQVPEIHVELDQDQGRGVVGVGEPPVIPGVAAIANAIHNACGARLFETPFTPDRVLRALSAATGKDGGR